jgi:dTDP-4-amino-4,6-dideoxygalactose transaminase
LTKPSIISSWPSFTEEEGEAIKNTLLSNKVNYWTGEESKLFEEEFAKWCGSRYAIALANGTLALDIALKAINIRANDEVIVTPRTFIASVSSVVNIGATPVFADVDMFSGNITANSISKVLTKKTKAIICVHLAGWPCDMDPILELAKENNIKVIEDCAQAHGALYKGKSVGTIGDIGTWSFCQDKIITTGGEGGMVSTNNKSLWKKMWSLKDHGKDYDAVYHKNHPSGFRWVHETFGTNSRILEIQSVIGRIQLKRIKSWTQKRNTNATRIKRSINQYPIVRKVDFKCNSNCTDGCNLKNECRHAYYKLYIYVYADKLKPNWSRDRLIKEISDLGIPCLQGGCPEVYMEKAFENTDFKPKKRLPNAKLLGESSLMFQVHPTLSNENIENTVNALNNIFNKASY